MSVCGLVGTRFCSADVRRVAQAAVRVHSEDEIERRRLSLDLAREFSEHGVAWAEADAYGNVAHRGGSLSS